MKDFAGEYEQYRKPRAMHLPKYTNTHPPALPLVTLGAAKGLSRVDFIVHYLFPQFVVILSAAKDLSRGASRCFAEFTLSAANVLSMTSGQCLPVTLPLS